MDFTIEGNLIDILQKEIYPATIHINKGIIKRISRYTNERDLPYILPGFIDSHVHIESSMLVPSEFARLAIVHGTVATVSDPHEIANVCGLPGVEFMIRNGQSQPFKFFFGASKCLAGNNFGSASPLSASKECGWPFRNSCVKYRSEMMNFPGVLNGD